ncbi:MAG: hypothetical protein VX767_03165 [Candidatus Neomarinimicrobiota bacterium]|nr:hypothetical protein [Candidatus Neomarinimicrobiota bacterium]
MNIKIKIIKICIIIFFMMGCDDTVDSWDPILDDTTFYKVFGGDREDYGFSVDVTKDGGYILAGFSTTYGNGSWDVWIVKTDSKGNGEWHRTFGTKGKEVAFQVNEMADGGYVILGEHGVPGKSGDILFIQTDKEGYHQNQVTYGGTANDGGRQIISTSDGGYAIIGYTYSYGGGGRDIWLIKTDENGKEEWNKTYGWVYNETGFSLIQTVDDGFLLVGSKWNWKLKKHNIWIVKVGPTGAEEWDRVIDEEYSGYGHKIIKSSDGLYTIAGVTKKLGNDWWDLWITKMDFSGNTIWEQIYTMSHIAINNWYYVDIAPTLDGGYICVGPTDQYGLDMDAILMKFDVNGNNEWKQTYGGKNQDIGLSVVQAKDGGFALLGRSNSYGNGLYDYFFVKTDSIGQSVLFPGK